MIRLNMSSFRFVRLLPVFAAIATSGAATELRVPQDFSTIGAALAASSFGDTIRIAAGIYSPSTNGETFPLVLESGVRVVGAGRDVTILDAQASVTSPAAVATCASRTNVELASVTIRGG